MTRLPTAVDAVPRKREDSEWVQVRFTPRGQLDMDVYVSGATGRVCLSLRETVARSLRDMLSAALDTQDELTRILNEQSPQETAPF